MSKWVCHNPYLPFTIAYWQWQTGVNLAIAEHESGVTVPEEALQDPAIRDGYYFALTRVGLGLTKA